MYFLTTLILLVGISLSSARPADPRLEFQSDLKKAFEPVQANVRAMAQNSQIAAKDLVKALDESNGNLLKAGEDFLKPVDSEDRANIRSTLTQRFANLRQAMSVNARNLLQRALNDAKPIQADQRSAVFGVRDAVQMLENKYLTSDGQDLVRMGLKLVID